MGGLWPENMKREKEIKSIFEWLLFNGVFENLVGCISLCDAWEIYLDPKSAIADSVQALLTATMGSL